MQVLHNLADFYVDPILAAVGQLQFEVVQYRMKDEYGVDTTLDPLPYSIARYVWCGGGGHHTGLAALQVGGWAVGRLLVGWLVG